MAVNLFTSLGVLSCGGLLIWRWFLECRTPLPASPIPQRLGLKKTLVQIFLLAVLLRLFTYLLAAFCLYTDAEDGATVQSMFEFWVRSDAVSYVQLAEKGYVNFTEDGQHLFLVFFPLYPWLMRGLTVLTGNTALSGLIISSLSFAGGCCYFYALAAERYGKKIAERAVTYLSVFPFAFFFGGVMTESLFFLLSTAALYYIVKHKWLTAGIIGIFACLSRMNGFLLVFAAGAELFSLYKPFGKGLCAQKWKRILKALPLVLLPLLGTLAYLFLNYWVDGDPFAFLIHQKHWYQGPSWVGNTLSYLVGNIFNHGSQSMTAMVWIPEISLFILFLGMLFLALRDKRHKSSLLVFGFLTLVSNYSLSWLLSAGRYLSVVSVFFLFLACFTEKKKALHNAFIIGMAMLQGILLMIFATRYGII